MLNDGQKKFFSNYLNTSKVTIAQVLYHLNKNLFKFEPLKDLLDFFGKIQKIFAVNICLNEFLQRCKYIPVIQFVYEKEDKLMI